MNAPTPDCSAPATAETVGWGTALIALGALLILTDFFDIPLYRLGGRSTELAPGVPPSRLMLLPVFAAAAILLAPRLAEARRLIRAAWPLWLAPLFCVASLLWSEQPRTTLLWSAALLGTTAFGLGLAVRFAPHVQAALVLGSAAVGGAASVAMVLWWPRLGVSEEGPWQGIFIHKNVLGKLMALAVTAAGAIAQRWPAPALSALLLCGALLGLTDSRASLLVAAITLAAIGLLLAVRRWRRHAAAIVAGGVAAAALALALLLGTQTGLAALGRNETFSQRTNIWRAVADTAADDVWLGRGYAAYWTGQASMPVRRRFNFYVSHAHNGYVDLFAELGLIGLLLVGVPLIIYTTAALHHAVTSGPPACLWPAALLIFFIVSNLAESPLLRHKLGWALYVAAACHVAAGRARPQ